MLTLLVVLVEFWLLQNWRPKWLWSCECWSSVSFPCPTNSITVALRNYYYFLDDNSSRCRRNKTIGWLWISNQVRMLWFGCCCYIGFKGHTIYFLICRFNLRAADDRAELSRCHIPQLPGCKKSVYYCGLLLFSNVYAWLLSDGAQWIMCLAVQSEHSYGCKAHPCYSTSFKTVWLRTLFWNEECGKALWSDFWSGVGFLNHLSFDQLFIVVPVTTLEPEIATNIILFSALYTDPSQNNHLPCSDFLRCFREALHLFLSCTATSLLQPQTRGPMGPP